MNLEQNRLALYPKKVLDNLTTLHGLKHLTAKRRLTRLVWVMIMMANVFFTAYLIIVIKERYNKDQIYTKVDGTCRVNQVPFPAVSICNANIVSKKESQKLKEILSLHNISAAETEGYLDALQHLRRFGYGSPRVPTFANITNVLRNRYFTVESLMEEIHQRCESLLLYCEFNRMQKDCSRVFKLIKTLEGFCCAFNYAALSDISYEPLFDEGEDVEYYDDRKVGPLITTSRSGRSSGLTVLLNLEPDDYDSSSHAFFYGAKVIINDPNDFPETTVIFKYIGTGESLDIKVEPMVFLNNPSIRRMPVPVRDCWFHDEVLLQNTDRYSFETCHTECMMHHYKDTCDCIPYRYPLHDIRTCDLSDLKCLHNVTVNGGQKCLCYLECSDKKYKVKSNIMPFSPYDFPEKYRTNLNLSQISGLKVYFGEATCNCYKKTLIMDYDQLIATYGGVLSLSAGASILTIVEIIYLAISYLVAVLWSFCRKYWTKHFKRNGSTS